MPLPVCAQVQAQMAERMRQVWHSHWPLTGISLFFPVPSPPTSHWPLTGLSLFSILSPPSALRQESSAHRPAQSPVAAVPPAKYGPACPWPPTAFPWPPTALALPFLGRPLPFALPFLGRPLPLHCLSFDLPLPPFALPFLSLPLPLHCLSLTSHCRLLHCLQV